jgi:hypothetical protein
VLVSMQFQVLFHSPNRGSFHLSLTVLVHYRSQMSIEPWKMVLPNSHRVPRAPWYLGARQRGDIFSPTGLSPSVITLPMVFG